MTAEDAEDERERSVAASGSKRAPRRTQTLALQARDAD